MTDGPGLDRYALTARWAPATLLTVPMSITLLLGLPSISATVGKVIAVMVALGAPVVVSQLVRDSGRRMQGLLYKHWGGAPTTLALRHRLSEDDAVAERLRRQLRLVVGDYPSVPEAREAPNTGDDVFEAITGVLRNKTRDPSMFPTVFDELVHYGFWRNAFAVRRFGSGVALVTTAGACLMAGLTASDSVHGSAANWIIAGVLDASVALGWLSLRAPRVRAAGDRYAEALLGSVENLPPAARTG